MAYVDLYHLVGSRKRKVESIKNMDVSPRDADECRALLRRLAKQHKIKPEEAELYVHEGRVKEFFRV